MKNGIQYIYCDESGSTGNNLLNRDQPIFSYASIAISPEEAQECVDKIVLDFRVQGGELKAKNLLSHHRGRKAITRILELQHDRMLVSLYDKKYSLACKLFEYAFEPVLASHNSIFYGVGFHKFIAAILFLHFKAGAQFAEEIFEDFEKLIRKPNDTSASYLFGAVRLPKEHVILDSIRKFCFHNRRTILEELDSLRGCGAGKWILDLTGSALFIHLGNWGEKYEQLDVYCDQSQALEDFGDFMKVMIGRRDKIYDAFFDQEQPITFNLLKEIAFVKSHNYPGVQLADIAAGAIPYALENKDDTEAKKWVEHLPGMLCRSVWPDKDHVDFTELTVQRNMMLLQELVYRSERGLSLTEGIPEFLYGATRYLRSQHQYMPSREP